jgi:hypothetical protein
MNKNITFFLVLSFFSAAFSIEHTTKTCSFEYVVSPKNSNDLNDFHHTTKQLLNLFEEIHRNPESNTTFYDKLLAFIKEVQEAVIAGVNLLSTSTSTNDTIVTINEVAQVAEEIVATVEAVQTIQAVEEIQTMQAVEEIQTMQAVEATQTKAIETVEPVAANHADVIETPKIKITTTISCDNQEKETLFEELKNKMDALAEAVNTQACTAEQFVEMLNAIIQESKQLDFAGNISINVQG